MTFLRTSTVVTWKPSAAQAGARTMTILPPGVFVYLHIYVFAYLCICVFAYLSICEFVYLRICVCAYLYICAFVNSRMCAFVSLLPSSTRPCQVVQLAHPVQPWEGSQLLHLLFRVCTWTRKSLFCTDGMGLPCELRYQQQRLFSLSWHFQTTTCSLSHMMIEGIIIFELDLRLASSFPEQPIMAWWYNRSCCWQVSSLSNLR